MDDVYDFGLILQKLRKERGMTQEQLAAKIHKESSIISRYEKNLQSPTFETVRSFAAQRKPDFEGPPGHNPAHPFRPPERSPGIHHTVC